jgi:exonuclease VII large subunit
LEKSVQKLESSLQEQFDSQQINVNKYLDTIITENLNELKKQQNERLDAIREDLNRLLDEKIALKLRDNTISTFISSLPESNS